jgi:hypothetical protein
MKAHIRLEVLVDADLELDELAYALRDAVNGLNTGWHICGASVRSVRPISDGNWRGRCRHPETWLADTDERTVN